MPASPTLSVLILAGGRSRRMGQDKALLSAGDGRSLLHKTAQVAQQLTPEVQVMTPWPERYGSAVPPGVKLIQERVAKKSVRGPLVGFSQGWEQISSDWCLLLACDLPYLEAAVLERWWQWLAVQLAQSQAPPAQPMASLTTGVKGWEPLCGYYHRRCAPGLLRYLAEGESVAMDARGDRNPFVNRTRSFQTWLKSLPIATYNAVPRRMLFNCNTPDDWAAVTL
ncbi:MAG: molybdenum cofactor guanylyltransferase [Phormidesmis sp.]